MSITWNDNGGDRWGITDQGFVVIDDQIPRTKGDPITAYTIYEDFGADIFDALGYFDISEQLLIALIWKESRRQKNGAHRDTVSIRKEPGYRSDTKTPNKISVGLMQTLLSTASSVNKKFRLFETYGGKLDAIDRHDLKIPRRSILLGAGYLHILSEKNDTDDPILLQAAYNAGGIYRSKKNRWNLRMYGKRRLENFAAYYNDALTMLGER